MNGCRFALVTALVLASETWGQNARSVYCCDGGFSIDRALALAQKLSRSDDRAIKLYLLSDRREDQSGRLGRADRGVADIVSDHLTEANSRRYFAFYIHTPRGEAIDLWDGYRRSFERRVVSASNPFVLADGSEIAFVTAGSSTMRIYCITRDEGTEDVGRKLLAEAAKLLGTSSLIEVVWDDNSWSFTDAAFPPFLPILGWTFPPRNPKPTQFRCTLGPLDKKASCVGLKKLSSEWN